MKKTTMNTAITPADLTQAYYEAKAKHESSIVEYRKHLDNVINLKRVKQKIRSNIHNVIQYTDTPLTASPVAAKSGGTLSMVYPAAPKNCFTRKTENHQICGA